MQRVKTPFGEIFEQRWGVGRPCLALHGWLDNSASFVELAPLLTNHELIAIDLPGHGLSDHHQHGFYHLWEYIPPLLHWLNQFEQPVDLIAHSMGGMVAPLLAVAAPEKFRKIVLIDSLGGPPYGSTELVSWLRKLQTSAASQRPYQSLDDMVKARMRGMTVLSYQAAEQIVKHQAYEKDGQWHWYFDATLKSGSPVRLRDEDYQACLSRIKCPLQVILAKSGWVNEFLNVPERLDWLPTGSRVDWVEGGHHCHLERGEVAGVAHVINDFLSE